MILAGAALATFSSFAMADTVDGVINFQGSIVSDTCKVGSVTGDAGTINVNMGTIATDDVGTVAAPKFLASGAGTANFNIACKTGAKVSMKFAGQPSELSADNKSIRVNKAIFAHPPKTENLPQTLV
ncbi:hypothetical protein WL48_10920 [Burkholderia ubonensis]|nr:hypothetical protein WL48_10920 [Burkholderia ubonensis]